MVTLCGTSGHNVWHYWAQCMALLGTMYGTRGTRPRPGWEGAEGQGTMYGTVLGTMYGTRELTA